MASEQNKCSLCQRPITGDMFIMYCMQCPRTYCAKCSQHISYYICVPGESDTILECYACRSDTVLPNGIIYDYLQRKYNLTLEGLNNELLTNLRNPIQTKSASKR